MASTFNIINDNTAFTKKKKRYWVSHRVVEMEWNWKNILLQVLKYQPGTNTVLYCLWQAERWLWKGHTSNLIQITGNSKGNRVITKPLPCCTYIVLWGSTEAARLALDALPLVRPHRLHHVVGELQARRVTYKGMEGRGGGDEHEVMREGMKVFTKQSQWCFLM